MEFSIEISQWLGTLHSSEDLFMSGHATLPLSSSFNTAVKEVYDMFRSFDCVLSGYQTTTALIMFVTDS